jgi:effector-binding domain-containing protein
MLTEPQVTQRAKQPYLAIRTTATMDNLGEVAPPLHPELFGWLGAHGIEPAGEPFWKYNVIDMARSLEIEVGVPIAAVVDGDDRVLAGVLPAGRYATVEHTGHPADLINATASLLDWAANQGLKWDKTETADGEKWRSRLEIYHTDPREEPDMNKWQTQLAFRLAD